MQSLQAFYMLLILVFAPSVLLAGPVNRLSTNLRAPQRVKVSSEFYVDLNGSDDNDGSKSAPFKTIQRAQLAARQALKQGRVTVNINEGTFLLNETLVFTQEDSGLSAEEPVIYKGTSEKHAEISGGVIIDGWTKAGNVPLGTIWQARLPEHVDYFYQMWMNGRRIQFARQRTRTYEKATPNSIIFKPGQLESIPENLDDVIIVLYESWTASLHQIESIDMESRNITLKKPFNDKWAGSVDGSRYYLANMKETLNVPLMFYVNRSSRTVFICVDNQTDLNQQTVVAPILTELIRVEGDPSSGAFVNNIEFRELTFKYSETELSSCFAGSCDGQSAEFLTTAAIHLSGAKGIKFDKLTLEHLGSYAVWFASGVFNSSLSNSYIGDLGAGGVRVGIGKSGIQPDPNLRTEHNNISNNIITDGGHIFQEGCGVLAQLVANTIIQHNLIYNFSYTGISLGWNWGYADTGSHNNLIAYNMIHDIGQYLLSDMGGWGLYTDEGSSYIELRDNIVYHTNGTDNTIVNNVFAEVNTMTCDGAIRSSQHPGTCSPSSPDGACSSFAFDTNIVYIRDYNIFSATIPSAFQNMTFDNNTYWKLDHSQVVFPEGKSFNQWKEEGKDVHSVIADPLFTNPEMNDWSHLSPKSPSIALGFEPINVTHVGPVGFHQYQHHQEQLRLFLSKNRLDRFVTWNS
eukprot:gene7413-525_t